MTHDTHNDAWINPLLAYTVTGLAIDSEWIFLGWCAVILYSLSKSGFAMVSSIPGNLGRNIWISGSVYSAFSLLIATAITVYKSYYTVSPEILKTYALISIMLALVIPLAIQKSWRKITPRIDEAFHTRIWLIRFFDVARMLAASTLMLLPLLSISRLTRLFIFHTALTACMLILLWFWDIKIQKPESSEDEKQLTTRLNYQPRKQRNLRQLLEPHSKPWLILGMSAFLLEIFAMATNMPF